MAWKWYDSKVIKIEDQSPTTKRFWVKVPGNEVIDFKAGQFVTMDLPIAEKRLKRWRSYSIANGPSETKVLEFSFTGSKQMLQSVFIGFWPWLEKKDICLRDLKWAALDDPKISAPQSHRKRRLLSSIRCW